ncbi:unnamed protein product, partial [Brassica rapa]
MIILLEERLVMLLREEIGLGDANSSQGSFGDACGKERRLVDFYNKWSEEKQFHVGDSQIFEYANEVNNVYEINGDLEFMTCDPTSPVAVHKIGHGLVRLTKP